ncbi:Cytochrome oxidase assembly protein ShyY1 [Micromonospora pattaloongensis]|uniref:SURF1-like protein n=1 Tax=Micromonospora pattaloongensis TaxID=405436 RepID=A0A1H3SW27_9ACTN|nr:SURF1 family protein [Micromonospora pattaloongensis]SDZ41329.1 Cytochrome oxidase assembly protein ShyY1 [Micromonospora pattaloongensis]
MYRFLLTPRWLGYLALTVAAAMVMVLLGNWQLDRYRDRTAINDRIDAGSRGAPAELGRILPAPGGGAGRAGPPPAAETAWQRVTATGRYDTANIVLVRNRSVEGRAGFEVLTPLVLADGSAVLVDRGWVPPTPGGSAMTQPEVPAAPAGDVTVVGRVHLSESGSYPVERRDGKLETRRVSVPKLARELPYPVYGAYLLLDTQDPPADPGFVPVPVTRENNVLNAAYVVQWWLFAVMALVGFGWVARREAHGGAPGRDKPLDRAAEPVAPAAP